MPRTLARSSSRTSACSRARPSSIPRTSNGSCLDSYILGEEYTRGMESAFTILAEPSRRAILSLLATAERSVGDLEEELQLSQPSVSKHLRVLREAGFVESRVDAQRRLYRIRPEPLMEVDA